MDPKIIYFAYGSNMWLDQMRQRCPECHFLGVGILSGWWDSTNGIFVRMHVSLTTFLHRKWIINVRGYANIIPSKKDIVYGFVFELTQADERKLDKFEGKQYERLNIRFEFA